MNPLAIVFSIGITAAAVTALGFFVYRSITEPYAEITSTPRSRNKRSPGLSSCIVGTCTICLEDIGISERKSLECGHVFHRKCIEKWLKDYNNNVCPNCKKVV